VAVFGMNDLLHNDANQTPEYTAFGDLTNVSFTNGKTGTVVLGSQGDPYVGTDMTLNLLTEQNAIIQLDDEGQLLSVTPFTVNFQPNPITIDVIGTKGTITLIENALVARALVYSPAFTFTSVNDGTLTTPAPDAYGGYAVDEITYIVLSTSLISATYRNILIVPGTPPIGPVYPPYVPWQASQVKGYVWNIANSIDGSNGFIVSNHVNAATYVDKTEVITLTDGTTTILASNYYTAFWAMYNESGTIKHVVKFKDQRVSPPDLPNTVATVDGGFCSTLTRFSQEYTAQRGFYNKDDVLLATLPTIFSKKIVVKFSPLGTYEWAWMFNQNCGSHGIATDPTTNGVYSMWNPYSNTGSSASKSDASGNIVASEYIPYPSISTPFNALSLFHVHKYTSSGAFDWTSSLFLNCIGDSHYLANDKDGNVFASVRAYVNVQGAIVDSTNAQYITPTDPDFLYANSDNAVIVKFDSQGVYQWNALVTSKGSNAHGKLAASPAGNLFNAGKLYATHPIHFWDASGSIVTSLTQTPVVTSPNNVFVAMYDTHGTPMWSVLNENLQVTDFYYTQTDDFITATWDDGCVIATMFTQSANESKVRNSDGTLHSTIPESLTTRGYAIIKYSSTGFVEWVVKGVGNFVNNYHFINYHTLSIAETEDRGIIMSGRLHDNLDTNTNVFTLTMTDAGSNTSSLTDTWYLKVNKDGLFEELI
jgi:hypothetical protein